MRALLLATSVVAVVFMSNSVIAQSDERAGAASVVRAEAPIVQVQPGAAGAPTVHVQPGAAGAPAVHVQPRAEDFYPHSEASEAEQERLSAFDAKQQKLDEALDKKLSICRC